MDFLGLVNMVLNLCKISFLLNINLAIEKDSLEMVLIPLGQDLIIYLVVLSTLLIIRESKGNLMRNLNLYKYNGKYIYFTMSIKKYNLLLFIIIIFKK